MKIHTLKAKPRGKLFLSVLATYLLLIVVTFSLLIAGYSFSLQQSIHDQETLQVAFLQQIRRELDFRLSAISRINNYLTTYPLTLSVSQYEEDLPIYQLDYQRLNEIIMEQNELIQNEGETVLYFDKSDSILTGSSRYRSVNLDAYTLQLGFTPEEFRNFLILENIKGELRILHSGTEKAELIYLQPILDDSFQRLGIVMTRLSLSYLREALSVNQWMDGSICHLANGDESIYIDSGGYGTTPSFDEMQDQDIPLQAEPVSIEISGKKFITVGLRSSNNSWNYYFSVPVSSFYSNSTFYYVLFAIALGFSLLFGLILAMLFSQRFSKPLGQILHSLYLNPEVAYPNAIQSIEKAFSTYQEDLTSAQNMLHRSAYHSENRFLYALCKGTLTPQQIDRDMDKYEISLDRDQPIFLVAAQYHDTDHSVFFQNGVLNNEMLLYASRNVLSELLCSESGAAAVEEGSALCIFQADEIKSLQDLREVLQKVEAFHREILGVEICLFVSHKGRGISDLPELFAEAEEMEQYKTFWNKEVPNILFYEELQNEETGTSNSVDFLSAEKRFINLLAIKDYPGAHQVLMEQFQGTSAKDLPHFQRERYKIFSFISNLLEALSSTQENLQQQDFSQSLNKLLAAKSILDLKSATNQLFQEIIESQNKQHLPDCPKWVQEVQDYIQEHFAEPTLNVSHLAEVFQLNLSYLSRSYKKYASIGVLDNIHMVRIAKAKELLSQGLSVQEVSERVGYFESRVFIRTFKRYEGVTPGQFQERTKL